MLEFFKSLFKKKPVYIWESLTNDHIDHSGRRCSIIRYKNTRTNIRYTKLFYDTHLYKRAADCYIEQLNYTVGK